MTFGCSLKQAWGVESFQREENIIKDNRRAHELPSMAVRVPKRKAPEPEPEEDGEMDMRVLYSIGMGVGAILLLDTVFRMGVRSA